MNYQYKYIKYNKKCESLKRKMNGGKYECFPQNSFKEICIEQESGKYNKKEGLRQNSFTFYIKYNKNNSKLLSLHCTSNLVYIVHCIQYCIKIF